MSENQRVWLITGCTSGFGKLFVPAILARGDKVIATARNLNALSDFTDSNDVGVLQLDVTASQEALNAKAAEAIALFGRVDVLVNNAGYVLSGVWEEVSHGQVVEQLNTNFFGHMNVTRAFLPHMRSRQTGIVLFMSSIAAWLGVAAGGPYSASKFALEGAVESLQKEISPLGLDVHLIVLGQFRTNILEGNRRQNYRSTPQIAEYDEMTQAIETRQARTSGKQPGDPERAVERLLDVVRREGRMAGKKRGEVPLRIPLGSDAARIMRDQCLEVLKQVEEYEEFACSTDFPGVSEIQRYS